MDFATLSTKDHQTATLVVKDPRDGADLMSNGKPVTITLAGMDSDAFQKAKRASVNRRLADRSGKSITAEELEKQGLQTLAACTVEWSGVVWEGKPLQCDALNAASLYAKVHWLREQVDNFISDRANFLPPSSAT